MPARRSPLTARRWRTSGADRSERIGTGNRRRSRGLRLPSVPALGQRAMRRRRPPLWRAMPSGLKTRPRPGWSGMASRPSASRRNGFGEQVFDVGRRGDVLDPAGVAGGGGQLQVGRQPDGGVPAVRDQQDAVVVGVLADAVLLGQSPPWSRRAAGSRRRGVRSRAGTTAGG